MNSFEVEIDAMRSAQADLSRLREALARNREVAAGLTNSVPPSASSTRDPVADKLHQIYLERAHTQGGVQGVLDDYLDELDQIQNTINVTLEAYAAGEREAASRYGGLPGEVH